ncbi:TetR/AcrR family transcriptional regulator [Rhodococcus sp. IEGM 1401]|uniref:TetR/AcrR family transcriptional regulator n=1 Tax=Rhodococcus cerastii TaxID=908616 RepID=A0ABU4CUL6_9NOCA|nr:MULTISPECIES: TetR/AcrR family transcriptional regulator [Rhodococcus]MCZ4560603.1 TetR/AcrR family transcriptional regulator [Rhodococcus sp. IEGM 1401]MDI9920731.1 TetR/AcrR family transcriptional regulator [Rhodococcus sp. IEGM 1372]MDV6301062.1 TetR/AcrR family transcriptional regulator [Rhodococcus cerastii]MDV8033232.1 TetR/AcrR family transcriptional regulator [Rhodococcus sp. IEGM 1414]MDV8075400.1 TetR/AcrR family transcriptional regulator [Rhodococcus sp. IEGM 1370]
MPRRTSSSTSEVDESSALGAAVDAPIASEPDAQPPKGSAHRPSRRHLIVQAAVRVFSRKGFAETSIQEIAEAAGMVPTAVYYHFAGKEELFDTALGYAMDASTAAAQAVRPDDTEADSAAFKEAVDAVWDWTAEHPDAARMLFLQVAGGATPGTRLLTKEYEDRHVRRAFDYFPDSETPADKRSAAAHHAARSLRARTMIATTIAIQPLRIEGGPLSHIAVARLRSATTDVCAKMIEGR